MSSVDNNSLNSILDKLGLNKPKEANKPSDTLGKMIS